MADPVQKLRHSLHNCSPFCTHPRHEIRERVVIIFAATSTIVAAGATCLDFVEWIEGGLLLALRRFLGFGLRRPLLLLVVLLHKHHRKGEPND